MPLADEEEHGAAEGAGGNQTHGGLQLFRQDGAALVKIRHVKAHIPEGAVLLLRLQNEVLHRRAVHSAELCIIGAGMEKIQHRDHGEGEGDDRERGLPVQPLGQIDQDRQRHREIEADHDPLVDPLADIDQHCEVHDHKCQVAVREDAGPEEDLAGLVNAEADACGGADNVI